MILLTGFKPFASRGVNGSETLSRFLSGRTVGGMPLVAENLDVFWGEPGKRLPKWIESYRPKLLLGLGEGSGDMLRFETRAANVSSGMDEKGQPPAGNCLDTDGPDFLMSTMHFDPSWVADIVPARASDDAGTFLCNAWLYTALKLDPVPAAFVHLPVQGDTPDADYCAQWASAIEEILARNLSDS